MDFGSPFFIVMIMALSIIGWLANNWIRAKHGYALEDEWGGKTVQTETAEAQRLLAENRALHEKLDAMQGRMVVLEKIVTDRGYSLSDEIEALRDERRPNEGAGVPLGLTSKERV
jgi:hypothetical protein